MLLHLGVNETEFLIKVYFVPGTGEPSPFTDVVPRDTHE